MCDPSLLRLTSTPTDPGPCFGHPTVPPSLSIPSPRIHPYPTSAVPLMGRPGRGTRSDASRPDAPPSGAPVRLPPPPPPPRYEPSMTIVVAPPTPVRRPAACVSRYARTPRVFYASSRSAARASARLRSVGSTSPSRVLAARSFSASAVTRVSVDVCACVDTDPLYPNASVRFPFCTCGPTPFVW